MKAILRTTRKIIVMLFIIAILFYGFVTQYDKQDTTESASSANAAAQIEPDNLLESVYASSKNIFSI